MATAHVYKRDHINTDEIIPARHLNTDDAAELAKHCMEDLDVNFVRKCKPGDVIVASVDFGCGSSREHAVWALQGAHVAAVIADTFARIFYRNCINVGLPVVEVDTSGIEEGDELQVDIAAGVVKNITKGVTLEARPLPPVMMKILSDGGLAEHLKKHGGFALEEE